jgi:hypothetical protein
MVYNKQESARSIAINSPAHKDLESLEVVMHAHSSGYWHTGSLEVKVQIMIKCGYMVMIIFRITG